VTACLTLGGSHTLGVNLRPLQQDALQCAMGPQLIAAVERLTRRTVRTFLSGTDKDGASAIEAFVLESEPPEAAAPNLD
jgi:hypothetical protein